MQGYLNRNLAGAVKNRLQNAPAVAILGPRQCGKTTLAKHIAEEMTRAVYLDLEHPADLAKLDDPVAFFDLHRNDLICLDEIQRTPDLFTILRSVIDEQERNGQFLILGSASRDLIRQSAESLAGRIAYLELTPFFFTEIEKHRRGDMRELWLRGGFPRSFLAVNGDASFEWRQDFMRTFLERDIAMLGVRIPPARLGRFWKMCAHDHGAVLNMSKLAAALDVSVHTIRSYVELLENTLMVRVLRPDIPNLKKRLVKSPKAYIRDSGILHALLGIRTHDDLLSHPAIGASFEGFAVENILAHATEFDPTFFRSRAGAEIDLVLRRGRRTLAFELKSSSVPKVSRGFRNALDDISADAAYVVAPVKESYPVKEGIVVIPPSDIPKALEADQR